MCVKPYKNVCTESLTLAECVRGPVAVLLAPKLLFFGENLSHKDAHVLIYLGKFFLGL